MGAHDIAAPWGRFIDAWRSDDDAGALRSIREFILVWDEAFWDNDFSLFPAVYTDDVEITNRTRGVSIIGIKDHRGVDGFKRLREEMIEVARFFRYDIQEVRRAGSDRVVALGKVRIRSRYAGLVLHAGFGVIWTLRDDKICRAAGYTSTRKALRDAGLSCGDGADEDAGIVYEAGSGRDLGD